MVVLVSHGAAADRRRIGNGNFEGRRMSVLAAVFNLNHPSHVVHWHFFQMSVANIAVIGVMLLVFALAIALPFPGAARRREKGS
jgi:site-specific recombinase